MIDDMINSIINKWWDSAAGLFGTGVMISIAHASGENTQITNQDWGILISGISTGFLMFVRATIMILTYIKKSRKERIKDNVKKKG